MNQHTALKERKILSVSELNQHTRKLIEQKYSQVWVEGEISNLARPSSGHWYFTLKDESAQVRCAMFTHRNRALRFDPQNGMQVILRGKASLYEGRGEFQLIAENLMPAGLGLLQQKFDTLKQKLYDEGLFVEHLKKILPRLPKHIAVITSVSGAALQDFLSVLERRFPAIPVLIIPSSVQGDQAKNQLVEAITLAQQPDIQPPIDVLVLTRGGGSLEDLWPFNEEDVARAIHTCHIPIISAVGHEVDFTIADFVADIRAPTPSVAAELISPDQQEWMAELIGHERWLMANILQNIAVQQQQLNSISQRLKHPGQKIQDNYQRLDDLESRMNLAIKGLLRQSQATAEKVASELAATSPINHLRELQLKNQQTEQKLVNLAHQSLQHLKQAMVVNTSKLNTLSPLNTLSRGYSILTNKNDQIVHNAKQTKIGEQLSARLAQGRIECRVQAISHDNE